MIHEIELIESYAPNRATLRRAGVSAMLAWLLLATLAMGAPRIAKGQVSWNGTTLETDYGSTPGAERRCVETMADERLSWGRSPFVCDAKARTNGRCPSTITVDQYFYPRKTQDCTNQDIPGTRGRCLYGRGPDTFEVANCIAKRNPVGCCTATGTGSCAAKPTCDAGEWGHVTMDLETESDLWCNGSSWVATTGQVPGQWRPTAIQCGAGPTHAVWPPGGVLEGVQLVADLPPCNADTNNLRMWVGATNLDRPWLDGTLYRCQSGSGWATGSGYREDVTDAGINAVCRNWQNSGKYWLPGLFASAPNWYALESKDISERDAEGIFFGRRDSGRGRISLQQSPITEE